MGDSKQPVPVELNVANNHLHSRGLAFALKGRKAKNTKCLSCLLLKNIAIGDNFPEDNKTYLIRGQKVMLDRDLAALYAVDTKVLKQAVKRNSSRFPQDFMFQLTRKEKNELVTNCDRFSM